MIEKLSPQVLADLNKILDEVSVPPLQEGEFTVRAVREARGITNMVADRLISKMVERGDAEFVGLRAIGSHNAKAYRLVPKKKGK